MKNALLHLATNWKTTLQSVLTSVMVLSGVAVTPNPWISTTLAAKILGAGMIAKVILGALQNDGIHIPPGSTVKQTTTVTTPPEGK
jgi:hypothetical protein